ncbi:TlpA family protein disulfide reductase [Imhoffiella purpurea]|uniref:Thioredoxin family protein, putative n=1 Tax=Imhoffiella purpurea TaxID=1249627 RepID=W9VI28_9GAMM|nr:TlpA disulfide reductase family protein [Imhoffiella purpurea]EXJ16661.1 thioredoxin family protein, putative [Imhoffiella purpurea]
MKPIKVVLVTFLAGGISIGAAIFGQQWLGESPLVEGLADRSRNRLDTLPDFRLTDLDGREVPSNAWAGKVLVLSYWAPWCPACLEELPLFVGTQEALGDSGVQFVGIAVDRPQDVRDFVAEHPINYPLLIADPEVIELSKRLGNRLEGLPFTIVFDRRGRRVFSQLGPMTEAELNEQLAPLIAPSTLLSYKALD